VIVFFATAHMTGFMAALANAAGVATLDIHSRKSQAQRDKASDAFRRTGPGSCAVLFTSNVSARGVDYPDVSHVIQVRGRMTSSFDDVSSRLRCAVSACVCPPHHAFPGFASGAALFHSFLLVPFFFFFAHAPPKRSPNPLSR
jgi:hypothetical protein